VYAKALQNKKAKCFCSAIYVFLLLSNFQFLPQFMQNMAGSIRIAAGVGQKRDRKSTGLFFILVAISAILGDVNLKLVLSW